MFRTGVAALVVFAIAAGPAAPAERIDHEVNAGIREEGRRNSQIMRTLHHLTDIYGPRITGSPNHKAAAEWAVEQLTDWGLQNGHLEPWTLGRAGWLNERFAGFILSPVKDSLGGEVLAWTPSTNGPVMADALQIVPPDRPTDAELAARFHLTRPTVKGHIVLVGRYTPWP